MASKKPPILTVAPNPDDGPGKQPTGKKAPVRRPQKRLPRKGTVGIPPPSADELAAQRLRDTQAVELAIAGLSYDRIADEVGYADRSGAYRAVRRALDRVEVPKVTELREMENARLDRLQAAWWTKAITDKDPHAASVVLRIFDRRAKLNGLDQQVARDIGALGDALLGDPDARRSRLIALRGQLDEAMKQQDGTG